MKTLLTVAAVVAAAAFALNAQATTPTTTTDAAKPAVSTTTPVTAASTGSATTVPARPVTTSAAATSAPAVASTEVAFSGQITNLNTMDKTCKVKDSTGKEWVLKLGSVIADGVKVGDMVDGKFDSKTNTLTSWRKTIK